MTEFETKLREILMEVFNANSEIGGDGTHPVDQAISSIKSLIAENLPKEEWHTHDSVLTLTGDVEGGCVTCIRNQAIQDCKERLK